MSKNDTLLEWCNEYWYEEIIKVFIDTDGERCPEFIEVKDFIRGSKNDSKILTRLLYLLARFSSRLNPKDLRDCMMYMEDIPDILKDIAAMKHKLPNATDLIQFQLEESMELLSNLASMESSQDDFSEQIRSFQRDVAKLISFLCREVNVSFISKVHQEFMERFNLQQSLPSETSENMSEENGLDEAEEEEGSSESDEEYLSVSESIPKTSEIDVENDNRNKDKISKLTSAKNLSGNTDKIMTENTNMPGDNRDDDIAQINTMELLGAMDSLIPSVSLEKLSAEQLDKHTKVQTVNKNTNKTTSGDPYTDMETILLNSDSVATDSTPGEGSTNIPPAAKNQHGQVIDSSTTATKKTMVRIHINSNKRRNAFTITESVHLIHGVKTCGLGNWTQILHSYTFYSRKSNHLKDRWRTMLKSKFISYDHDDDGKIEILDPLLNAAYEDYLSKIRSDSQSQGTNEKETITEETGCKDKVKKQHLEFISPPQLASTLICDDMQADTSSEGEGTKDGSANPTEKPTPSNAARELQESAASEVLETTIVKSAILEQDSSADRNESTQNAPACPNKNGNRVSTNSNKTPNDLKIEIMDTSDDNTTDGDTQIDTNEDLLGKRQEKSEETVESSSEEEVEVTECHPPRKSLSAPEDNCENMTLAGKLSTARKREKKSKFTSTQKRRKRRFDFSSGEDSHSDITLPTRKKITADSDTAKTSVDNKKNEKSMDADEVESSSSARDRSDEDAVKKVVKNKTPAKSSKRRFLWDVEGEQLTWDDSFLLEPKTIKRKTLLSNSVSVRYKKKFWLTWEKKNLLDGVRRFGVGQWSMILNHFKFQDRTSVMLKDKWRTMMQYNEVPADLLAKTPFSK